MEKKKNEVLDLYWFWALLNLYFLCGFLFAPLGWTFLVIVELIIWSSFAIDFILLIKKQDKKKESKWIYQ